jgi:hypothetical protein
MVSSRRRLVALLLVLAVLAVPGAGWAAPLDEDELLGLINDARLEAGLPSVELEPALVADARRHTSTMVEAGDVFHSSPAELAGYASGWELLGENVGFGPDPRILHEAFMASDTHRENILGDFDAAAVGAARAGDGTLFATVVFIQRSGAALELPVIPDSIRSMALFPTVAVARAWSLAESRLAAAPERAACGPATAPGGGCID